MADSLAGGIKRTMNARSSYLRQRLPLARAQQDQPGPRGDLPDTPGDQPKLSQRRAYISQGATHGMHLWVGAICVHPSSLADLDLGAAGG